MVVLGIILFILFLPEIISAFIGLGGLLITIIGSILAGIGTLCESIFAKKGCTGDYFYLCGHIKCTGKEIVHLAPIAIKPDHKIINKLKVAHDTYIVYKTMATFITGLIAFTLWYLIWGRKGN